MKLTPELKDVILNGTPDERKYILQHSFMAFSMYYFTDYFTYKPAPFHKDFAHDCEQLAKGDLKEVAWVGFKECAKTSYAKMFVTWNICYAKRHFVNYDSYDKGNAESALFDVVVELQTNRRLIHDFGNLFTEDRDDKEKKLKKVTSFITANDVKVEAFSTGQSTRGRLYKNFRPDLYVIDDVENFQTIASPLITQKIVSHIDELRSGLAAEANVLYLGNYLTDQGVVQYILDTVTRSQGQTRFIPVEKDGIPMWEDKYCMTDTEAAEFNKENPNRPKKISIETKKRDLGETVFMTEMQLSPLSTGDLLFQRNKVEKLLEVKEEDYEDLAGFRVWDKFNPRHRYAIGADTALGIGRDSNTSVLMDFSTFPARQIGTFSDNHIPPDVFAHELKREGVMFGECLIAPEVNGTGFATVTELKSIYDIEKIYRPLGKGVQYEDRHSTQLGFQTNPATKPDMLFQLKTAIEDGLLTIMDKRILKEMKAYRRTELYQRSKDPLATRHFDLLIATAICWAMRHHAVANEDGKLDSLVQEAQRARETAKRDTGA